MGGCYNQPYGAYGPGYGYGGQYGPQYGPQYGYGGGMIDADPITPGIQSTPGIVTPVGPSMVSGVGYPGYPGYSGYPGSALPPVSTFGGYNPTIIPPGIPPMVPQVPPMITQIPPMVSQVSPMITQVPPIITPPIVSQPLATTTFAPSMIGGLAGSAMLGSVVPSVGLRPTMGIDIDPITPGIQTAPGIVSGTGPSYILGL